MISRLPRVGRVSVIVLAITVSAGCSTTTAPARFSFVHTPYGFLRVDTQTGQTSGLHNGQWVPINEARYSMDDLVRGGASAH